MEIFSFVALMATLSGAALAKDAAPEVLTRSGKWVVDYGRDACHIYAEFGAGDAKVIARFTRYAPTDRFTLAIAGNRVRGGDVHELVSVDFWLRSAPAPTRVMTGTAGGFPALFFGPMRIDGAEEEARITPEQEAASSGLTIAMRGRKPFHLETGSLGKPFEVMRDCVRKLIVSWGYDPDVQAKLSQRVIPVGSPARWITASDYPETALQEGFSGIVQFRLDVDAEGEVAGCYILDRTEPDTFAAVTCSNLKRRAKLSLRSTIRGHRRVLSSYRG